MSNADRVKRYRQKHPQRLKIIQRNSDALHRYGISSYAEMCKIRNRTCMICDKKAKKMCIDHDGLAGVFNKTYRGVLCQQCNVRLGWFEKLQKKILKYLKRGSYASSIKKAANNDGDSRAFTRKTLRT